jgi:predicted TIM-barrel fold metal-dependent hydrolase
MIDTSPEKMIEVMDGCGITRACSSHIVGLYSHNIEFAYEETLEIVERFRGRLYGYALYDPFLPEESLRLIERYLPMDGFIGIKIHPAMHEYPLDGGRYDPLWEFADSHETVVLTHTYDATPLSIFPYEVATVQKYAEPRLVKGIAGRFPGVKLILGHGGGHYYGQVQAIEMARLFDNVYVDISGEAKGYGVIEWFVHEIGAHKVLYASDMNWLDPRGHIGRVIGARISLEEKELILYKNAEGLFNFVP